VHFHAVLVDERLEPKLAQDAVAHEREKRMAVVIIIVWGAVHWLVRKRYNPRRLRAVNGGEIGLDKREHVGQQQKRVLAHREEGFRLKHDDVQQADVERVEHRLRLAHGRAAGHDVEPTAVLKKVRIVLCGGAEGSRRRGWLRARDQRRRARAGTAAAGARCMTLGSRRRGRRRARERSGAR
jgi:hypothetical protein